MEMLKELDEDKKPGRCERKERKMCQIGDDISDANFLKFSMILELSVY